MREFAASGADEDCPVGDGVEICCLTHVEIELVKSREIERVEDHEVRGLVCCEDVLAAEQF